MHFCWSCKARCAQPCQWVVALKKWLQLLFILLLHFSHRLSERTHDTAQVPPPPRACVLWPHWPAGDGAANQACWRAAGHRWNSWLAGDASGGPRGGKAEGFPGTAHQVSWRQARFSECCHRSIMFLLDLKKKSVLLFIFYLQLCWWLVSSVLNQDKNKRKVVKNAGFS